MKSIRIIVAFIIFSLLFINCQNKNYDNFFENEKLRLIDAAEETIEKLGLENFEILAYTHKSISNKIISKNINNTKYLGDYPADIDNAYGWVQERTIAANYDPNAKNEIIELFGNFSF
jgi:hypothetical protein